MGASPQPVTVLPAALFDNGIASNTNEAAATKHILKTNNQLNLFKTKPAKNLPNAVDPANMLAICMLKATGSIKTLLLKVGSQLMILCSMST